MAISQNGWTVLVDRPPSVLIPGTDIRLAIRGGNCAFLLTRVASWFHRHIERLDMPVSETPGYDDWGWAYRAIRGQTTGFSNHASATAIDLNATRHPRGVKGTFSRVERDLMHAHLLQYKDTVTGRIVVRWGEDYAGTVDGMHFEINADSAAVTRVATRLRELDKPKPPPDPLEEIMALDPAARAAFISDIADEVMTRAKSLGPSAQRELGVDSASLFDLAAIAAASAVDTRQAVARVETSLAEPPAPEAPVT